MLAQAHTAAKLLQMMHDFNLLPSKRDDPAYFQLQLIKLMGLLLLL